MDKAKKRAIVRAMILASIVGLIVPLFVISLTLMALIIFKSLNIVLKAVLMIIFGLAGLAIGSTIYLKILHRLHLPITPERNEEREQ